MPSAMSDDARVRLGSIVVNCRDFPAMLAFWQAALGYVPRYPPDDGWVVLHDPRRPNVNLSLQRDPNVATGRHRLHLDLYTEDQPREVRRLRALGATLHPRTAEPGEDFVVLADPDGNLFCVVQEA